MFPRSLPAAPELESQVLGDLSLAAVAPVGDDLEIAYADILSFRSHSMRISDI